MVFLAVGYQTAMLMHRAAVERADSLSQAPDTVYVVDSALAARVLSRPAESVRLPSGAVSVRREAPREGHASAQGGRNAPEVFEFDPNTVSVSDLQRLGFSPRQALAIDRYRQKGGRFHRREDFARSFVVSDSTYRRLEGWISIPKTDLNTADSATLLALPGIGKYYASRLLSARRALYGYSTLSQVEELLGAERYKGLEDLVYLSDNEPYPLWTLPEDSLSRHPYIGPSAARGIVLYREQHPRHEWTLEGVIKAGILPVEYAGKLSGCRIAE